jgi:serine protease Do
MTKQELVEFIMRNKKIVIGSAAVAVVVLSTGAYALMARHSDEQTNLDQPVSAALAEPAAYTAADSKSEPPRMMENGTPFSFADLVERVSPAVVSITADETQQVSDQLPEDMPDPFKQFFKQFGQQGGQGQPHEEHAISAGSGFIIDKDGLIVTNNHVIDGSKKITVKLPDGRSFDAKVIGTDPATDIALLKVKADKPLPTVEFGNDRQLRVGDWVVAVGNPYGLSNSVTAGIVSSIGRDLGGNEQPYTDFIQIDAPINRGNSGGPTFDLRGQVIGMNSMIFSPTGGSIGIGFAIPASTIKDVVGQLLAHGHVSRGWLGVEIQSLTPEMAATLGIAEPKGAIVANVVPGGPADKAGVHQGDVIVAINGQPVQDSHDLTLKVAGLPAGKPAPFTLDRNGHQETVSVVIGQRKEEQVASIDGQPQEPAAAQGATGSAMGLGLAELTPDIRHTYNLDDSVQGVVVTKVDPDSDAADKGLEPGDVLLKVGYQEVHSPKDVEKTVAAAQSKGQKSVLLLVASDGTPHFVAVDIGKT